MHDEAPYQYEDTISLFNYGFSNFEKVNVSETETKYNIDNTGFFYSGNDIFGNSQPILSLNEDDFIVLPRTVTFEETETTISYETQNENQAAVITYTYQGVDIGSVRVNFVVDTEEPYIFDTLPVETAAPIEEEEENSVIFVNIVKVLVILAVLAVIIIVIIVGRAFLRNYEFTRVGRKDRNRWRTLGRKSSRNRRRKGKRPNRFRDYDF